MPPLCESCEQTDFVFMGTEERPEEEDYSDESIEVLSYGGDSENEELQANEEENQTTPEVGRAQNERPRNRNRFRPGPENHKSRETILQDEISKSFNKALKWSTISTGLACFVSISVLATCCFVLHSNNRMFSQTIDTLLKENQKELRDCYEARWSEKTACDQNTGVLNEKLRNKVHELETCKEKHNKLDEELKKEKKLSKELVVENEALREANQRLRENIKTIEQKCENRSWFSTENVFTAATWISCLFRMCK